MAYTGTILEQIPAYLRKRNSSARAAGGGVVNLPF
jgi:hypothetical protein